MATCKICGSISPSFPPSFHQWRHLPQPAMPGWASDGGDGGVVEMGRAVEGPDEPAGAWGAWVGFPAAAAGLARGLRGFSPPRFPPSGGCLGCLPPVCVGLLSAQSLTDPLSRRSRLVPANRGFSCRTVEDSGADLRNPHLIIGLAMTLRRFLSQSPTTWSNAALSQPVSDAQRPFCYGIHASHAVCLTPGTPSCPPV